MPTAAAILEAPGFGRYFTDHMVRVDWSKDGGWDSGAVLPYAPLTMDPASMALHYGQLIFEGLKAYEQPDGSVATFRPTSNAERFRNSARRLAMPELPTEIFVDSLHALVEIDRDWVPAGGGENALYLRPFMISTEVGLGVKPASSYAYLLIASPAGAYFPRGVEPVSVWLSTEYTRAAPGGTGEAKCAGNYAASLIAQAQAADEGCDQVVWLDALEHRWVEEMGGMNLYFVYGSGPTARIVTPSLSGTLLPGITRDSLLTVARGLGYTAEEDKISTDSWRADAASGALTEVFACGTPRSSRRSAWSRAPRASSRSATAGPARSRCSCAMPCSTYRPARARTRTGGCTSSPPAARPDPAAAMTDHDRLARLRIAGEAIVGRAGEGLHHEVPSCPGWTLADLVRHLGAIHRWAHAIVDGRLDGRPRDMFAIAGEQDAAAAGIPDAELVGWFAEGHAALVGALERTPSDAAFWTFGPGPSPVAFWVRRQAHETAIHAIDAQLAVTTPDDVAPLPMWFAVDGIAELLEVFASRPGAKARSAQPRTMLVAPIDDATRWLVTIGPDAIGTERVGDDATADATLSGTAHDLYSALWNRSPIDRVDIDGDPAVTALWADGVKIT